MAEEQHQAAGVEFALEDGKRSSTKANKAVFSEAVAAVDADLAGRISSTGDWRKSYIDRVRDIVVAGTRVPKDSLRIAADGLAALNHRVTFVDAAGERGLTESLRDTGSDIPATHVVEGEGTREKELTVPYKGRQLRGDDLLRQLDEWQGTGALERTSADALSSLVADPSRLDVSDRHFVLLGAASEMGPLEALSRWGANIIAVDLPRRYLWDHIVSAAQQGSGKLFMPVSDGSGDPAERAGVDLLTDLPRIRDWLLSFDADLIVGNYVYADGGTFVRLSASVDALIADLLERRSGNGLAYLATPTDVFAVSDEIVAAARSRASGSPAKSVARLVTGSRIYSPNYSKTITDENGRQWGISDCLVPIQGANYALSKSAQRWRALITKEEGRFVSANVAPASHTRSVVKNKMLAAAYRGAGPYGVEIFEAATSRVLMAALLVHDLRRGPTPNGGHPFDLFVDQAIHGGIWRLPYQPRTVLPLALLRGSLKR